MELAAELPLAVVVHIAVTGAPISILPLWLSLERRLPLLLPALARESPWHPPRSRIQGGPRCQEPTPLHAS